MNRSELKRNAKESLNGKYGESIKLFLLYILVCFGLAFVISFMEGIFKESEFLIIILGLVPSFIIYGLYSGFYSFFLKISRNEEVTCKELFNKFNLFWITIGTTLLASIFSFCGTLLFIVPGIIIALNYSMVYFVIVDNPELGVMEVLAESKRLMKGHRIDFIMLNLSFIGWYILSYFTLGLLLLWFAPYMLVTQANFYNKLKERA